LGVSSDLARLPRGGRAFLFGGQSRTEALGDSPLSLFSPVLSDILDIVPLKMRPPSLDPFRRVALDRERLHLHGSVRVAGRGECGVRLSRACRRDAVCSARPLEPSADQSERYRPADLRSRGNPHWERMVLAWDFLTTSRRPTASVGCAAGIDVCGTRIAFWMRTSTATKPGVSWCAGANAGWLGR
jgi:hypothetical protein